MILSILKLEFLSLIRDRLALVLIFVVPIVIYSIFSLIYLEINDKISLPKVEIAVADLSKSKFSERLISELEIDKRFDVIPISTGERGREWVRQKMIQLVGDGEYSIGMFIPSGFNQTSNHRISSTKIELFEDYSDLIAIETVSSGVQILLFKIIVEAQFAEYGILFENNLDNLINFKRINVLNRLPNQNKRSAISFSAAGVGVLFLLFAMTGVGGSLIDEESHGILERLLNTNISMGRILFWKWMFASLIGFIQVFVMFLWGWLFFDLDLFAPSHFVGFFVITLFTTCSAAALGIALATMCRSRVQLNSLSTVLILIMSALGGSMFPRYLMPESLNNLGLLTFNAWALDGYQKVFWYEAGILELWPQVLVLGCLTILFLSVARQLARRWEAI